MKISKEKFENLVAEAMENLPEKFKAKLHNVAIIAEDRPTKEQLRGAGRTSRDYTLFGLFEGYCQARRANIGPVLPDRITIFRKAICDFCSSEDEIKKSITSTVKHEIAHHFGSDEKGASKASKN
ncbi:metallopeptidase family protein [Patescibacteria group bacterium]|nr:metallopeptidase family protein [Patescibacteria group bacterium]MBU4455344.1 metallopeptidase family protein [Patescibacteria group bacterium]MCG2690509.1 metallopeptidase family protein [Candidatus Parcubacteria bacterium]